MSTYGSYFILRATANKALVWDASPLRGSRPHSLIVMQHDKTTYEIDGAYFSTLEGFYEEVSNKLIPGALWGKNLDAFNDILRGGFGTPDGGFVLKWRNSKLSRERLGYAETVRQLERRLQRCHPSNRESVSKDLANAKQGIGPTVYDWLIEIIGAHGVGGEEQEDGVGLVLE